LKLVMNDQRIANMYRLATMHTAQSQTDGQTDRQTDDSIMPIGRPIDIDT